MIEVQNLSKRYPTRLAVDDVTFAVREGEIVGFLGPNGAGKTTTMRVLTGFLPPTSGSARVAGHDIVTRPDAARASLGYLPESAATYGEMRVREYLAFRARLEGVARTLVKTRVAEALERCLLGEVAGRKIENLSKGFKQRTALAGALVHQPPVLILDEPTIGLDPVQIIKIRETIRELGKNRAVLLSTHILPEVEAVCDRVLIIDRGRIVAEGTPSELRGRLAGTPVVRVVFRDAPAGAREALATLDGVTAVALEESSGETRARLTCTAESDPREAVYRLAVENGWVLRELGREAMTLEDVFVRLTRREEPAPAEEARSEASEAPDAGAGSEEGPAS